MISRSRDFLRAARETQERIAPIGGAGNTMKITIYGKQMSVRESLKEAVEKKLPSLISFSVKIPKRS